MAGGGGMSEIIRRVPKLVYALAFLFFVWAVGNGFWQLRLTNMYGGADNPMISQAKSEILYRAALDSAFFVTSGVMIDVLIRILDRLSGKAETEE
jgi:hypothetical protein